MVFLHSHYSHSRYLASGGYDSIVNILDLNDWICIRTITACKSVGTPLTLPILPTWEVDEQVFYSKRAQGTSANIEFCLCYRNTSCQRDIRVSAIL